MSAITEFFGYYTKDKKVDWKKVLADQHSRYTGKRSIKVRKSQPEISIGTVVIKYGKNQDNLIIDPERFLENRQVFKDCIPLLTKHVAGNDIYLIPEVKIPGGNVDFFLVSAKEGVIVDFVGIELQALDTTGSLWAERQKLLVELGLEKPDLEIKPMNFGINWKMTAKTTLVQLHHKIGTFEHLDKKFVLVIQDHLLNYIRKEFNFSKFHSPAQTRDSMQIHSYKLTEDESGTHLVPDSKISTDSYGLAESLGLMADAKIELKVVNSLLEKKMASGSMFKIEE